MRFRKHIVNKIQRKSKDFPDKSKLLMRKIYGFFQDDLVGLWIKANARNKICYAFIHETKLPNQK